MLDSAPVLVTAGLNRRHGGSDRREMMPDEKELEFLDANPLAAITISSDRTDFEI